MKQLKQTVWMNRVVLAVILTLFAAMNLQAGETEKPVYETGDDVTKQVQTWIDEIRRAEDYEEIADLFGSELSGDDAMQIFTNIRENLALDDMEAVFCAYVEDTLLVYMTYNEPDGAKKEYIQFMETDDNRFCYKNSSQIWETINQRYLCPSCGGSGQIMSGGTVCAICSGTGQQYIPNLYYDMNMGWYGGYTICSGCAGSGYIGNASFQICGACQGFGLIF